MLLPLLSLRCAYQNTDPALAMRMTLPDAKTRAAMLATGMERGMEASYVRFETQIAGEWARLLGDGDHP